MLWTDQRSIFKGLASFSHQLKKGWCLSWFRNLILLHEFLLDLLNSISACLGLENRKFASWIWVSPWREDWTFMLCFFNSISNLSCSFFWLSYLQSISWSSTRLNLLSYSRLHFLLHLFLILKRCVQLIFLFLSFFLFLYNLFISRVELLIGRLNVLKSISSDHLEVVWPEICHFLCFSSSNYWC